jgi:virginiamycin B lyase
LSLALILGVMAIALPTAAPAAVGVPGFLTSQSKVAGFRLPHSPSTADALIGAPEGGAWFTAANGIAGESRRYLLSLEKIDPQGQVTTLVERKGAGGFARTADGSVWFTGFDCICRLSPIGEVTEVPLLKGESERSIAQGPIVAAGDGSLWYSSTPSQAKSSRPATIGRLSVGGQITEFPLPGSTSSEGWATSMTIGPEGKIWFTQLYRDAIGYMSLDGQVSTFQLPQYAHPDDIAAGADGSLWFTEHDFPRMIGRITPTGETHDFPLPGNSPSLDKTTAGPDGRIWFAYEPGTIGRIAPNGGLSLIALPNATQVLNLTVGIEGDVWYTADPGPPCAPGDIACLNADPTEPGIIGRVEPGPLAGEIAGARAIDRGRWVKVKVGCVDGEASSLCRGRLQLRSGDAIVAGRHFQLETDRSRGFDLRLTGAAAIALQDTRHLNVTCVMSIEDGTTRRRVLHLALAKRTRVTRQSG